ncbi:hypothetical protein IP84_09295 [beta proteobacterium AAP99]|nr:hypothetical protein IP84_09295 [beta proteobacterium AAP99]
MATRPLPTDALTTAQAAARLGVSTQTIQKWVDQRLLDAWRTLGGHRRVSTQSVETLLASRQAQLASAPAVPATSTDQNAAQIMVVEDDSIEAELISEILSALCGDRARVLLFNNPFDALLHAGNSPPDVLLADVNMPGMDGVAMVRHLVCNQRLSGTRIALVTHFSRDEVERLGELPQGVLYLRKPITHAVLSEALPFLNR